MGKDLLHSTLEEIENDYWGDPENDSHLVITCHKLRKKKLSAFTIEDLRIMIGQNMGLGTLIPLAIKKLRHNILAEGDLYKGDLLTSVLTADVNFWKTNPFLKEQIMRTVSNYIDEIELSNPKIVLAYKQFEQI